MDLDFFKKKELGLPIWAWALIASVLLYFGYRYFKNKSASSGSSTTTPLAHRLRKQTTPVVTVEEV